MINTLIRIMFALITCVGTAVAAVCSNTSDENGQVPTANACH